MRNNEVSSVEPASGSIRVKYRDGSGNCDEIMLICHQHIVVHICAGFYASCYWTAAVNGWQSLSSRRVRVLSPAMKQNPVLLMRALPQIQQPDRCCPPAIHHETPPVELCMAARFPAPRQRAAAARVARKCGMAARRRRVSRHTSDVSCLLMRR